MKASVFRLRLAWVPALALLGTLGLAANGLAQQQGARSGTASDADQTGAGPRGTPGSPSSNPTKNTMPASPPASTTGMAEPRGTPGSASTEPGAPTNQTPQQTR